jgi:hypothetical protein
VELLVLLKKEDGIEKIVSINEVYINSSIEDIKKGYKNKGYDEEYLVNKLPYRWAEFEEVKKDEI